MASLMCVYVCVCVLVHKESYQRPEGPVQQGQMLMCVCVCVSKHSRACAATEQMVGVGLLSTHVQNIPHNVPDLQHDLV